MENNSVMKRNRYWQQHSESQTRLAECMKHAQEYILYGSNYGKF